MVIKYLLFEEPLIIEVAGIHARRYLNSRLTLNVERINEGEAGRGAALTPQGKVEALVDVACLSKRSFLVINATGSPELAWEGVIRYKVAERADFNKLEGAQLIHVVAPVPIELSQRAFFSLPKVRLGGEGADLCFRDRGEFEEAIQELGLEVKEVSSEDYFAARVFAGQPALGLDFPELTLFPEVLGFEGYISTNQGCYPGQEVIERVTALGKPPRRIVRFVLTEPVDRDSSKTLFMKGADQAAVKLGEVTRLVTFSEPNKSLELPQVVKGLPIYGFGFGFVKNREFEDLFMGEAPLAVF